MQKLNFGLDYEHNLYFVCSYSWMHNLIYNVINTIIFVVCTFSLKLVSFKVGVKYNFILKVIFYYLFNN